jgi:predicted dehydrogenase
VELFTMMNGQEVSMRNQPASERGNSYFKLIENFVRRIDGDESVDIPTPAQALVDVRIIDAIMRSAAARREITL